MKNIYYQDPIETNQAFKERVEGIFKEKNNLLFPLKMYYDGYDNVWVLEEGVIEFKAVTSTDSKECKHRNTFKDVPDTSVNSSYLVNHYVNSLWFRDNPDNPPVNGTIYLADNTQLYFFDGENWN